MKEIMLDLETMGVGNDAAIIAVGAVVFDLASDTYTEENSFYSTVDLQSAVSSGGVISPSTVMWWMQQSDEARAEFIEEGAYIKHVLLLFGSWVGQIREMPEQPDIQVWGNGSDFDNVILRSAYERAGLPVPWHFRENRCFRTMRAMHPTVDTSAWNDEVKHKAVDDARWQARYLFEIVNGGE